MPPGATTPAPARPRRLTLALLGALAGCGAAEGDTWLGRLAPLTPGGEVLPGYVLGAPRRGYEHDLVLPVTGPDGASVEVHVVDRGRWPDALPVGAYAVDWEQPHTTAPPDVADAVTRRVADALDGDDGGSVDEIAVGDEPPTALTPVTRALRHTGLPGVVPGFTLGALLAGALAAGRRARDPDALAVGAIAAAARLVLGPWAPLHTNGQGNLWIAGASSPDLLHHYGPGYPELWGLLVHLGRPDTVIFAGNALLSAALPALTVVLARGVGCSRAQAAFAGLALAFDPVAVRAGATEAYLVPAALLAALAAVAAQRDDREGLAAVALCAAAAARLHPAAWLPMAIAPSLAGARGLGAVGRAAVAAAMGAALGGGAVVADVLAAISDGRLAPAPVSVTPPQVLAAAGVGLAVTWRRPAVAPAAWAAVALDLALRGAYGQHPLWQAAFDRLWAVPVAVGLAAVLPRALPAWALAVGVTALGAPSLPMLGLRTIDQHEHRWAREALDALPAGCVAAYVTRTDPVTTVTLPVPPPGVRLLPLDARGAAEAPLPDAACLRYLRTSACSSVRGAAACARLEAGLDLGDGVMTTLPAVPSHHDVAYPAPVLEVGVFPLAAGRR